MERPNLTANRALERPEKKRNTGGGEEKRKGGSKCPRPVTLPYEANIGTALQLGRARGGGVGPFNLLIRKGVRRGIGVFGDM